MTHLKNLRRLLETEAEFERREYQEGLTYQSPKERVRKGRCWYPLMVKEDGYGFGDYPYLEVEFPGNGGFFHHFGAGKPVSFFSNHPEYAGERLKGTIQFVSGNRMKVQFRCDELPDWVNDGKLGVDLEMDNASYAEMFRALDVLEKPGEPSLKILLKKLELGKSAFETLLPQPVNIKELNLSQQMAAGAILDNKDLVIVHGPPGTGKTTTLVHAIRLLTKTDQQILVCAPSNAACDLLAERLHRIGIKVVRLGNLSKISQDLWSLTPEGILDNHPDTKNIKTEKKRADEWRRMAGKYKRKYGPEEARQRKLLLQEAKKLAMDVRKRQEGLAEEVISRAEVIVTTPIGSTNESLKNRVFDTVIIDECGQALESISLVPMLKGRRFVLAGDPFQLPPTVHSDAAASGGLAVSLLERCISLVPNVFLLDTQYRMHQHIMGFSARMFYSNRLLAHPSVANRLISAPEPHNEPVVFIDTAGTGFEEERAQETEGLENPGERELIFHYLAELAVNLTETPSLALISPYRRQVEKWKEEWNLSAISSLYPHTEIDTIDAFQGREKDMVVISLVRSNNEGNIGFLRDIRRMNVAITRAALKLVVIGDSATIGNHPFYEQFIRYAGEKGKHLSAWEFMHRQ